MLLCKAVAKLPEFAEEQKVIGVKALRDILKLKLD